MMLQTIVEFTFTSVAYLGTPLSYGRLSFYSSLYICSILKWCSFWSTTCIWQHQLKWTVAECIFCVLIVYIYTKVDVKLKWLQSWSIIQLRDNSLKKFDVTVERSCFKVLASCDDISHFLYVKHTSTNQSINGESHHVINSSKEDNSFSALC